MVVDTSAVFAILLAEPEAAKFAAAIERASVRLMSAGTALEVSIVAMRQAGDEGRERAARLTAAADMKIVAFTDEHLGLAQNAFQAFGRGRHRAGLNFGDCFSYALSKASGEPLLFKGVDFAQTDIVPAL